MGISILIIRCDRNPPALHSFPTRRSSDLRHRVAVEQRPAVRLGKLVGRVVDRPRDASGAVVVRDHFRAEAEAVVGLDRKSTRLNSSHSQISYAVFCLKKKKSISLRMTR